MTSKIIVNNIEADVGVSTITFGSNIQGNITGNVTGNINSTGISTFTTIQGSSNTITVPTGHRVVGVDTGGFIAPGMILQRQVKVFTTEVQLAQQLAVLRIYPEQYSRPKFQAEPLTPLRRVVLLLL
jgi:hypothetical protein